MYISGNSHDRDWVHKELELDGWMAIEQSEASLAAQRIFDLSPSLLIDLVGTLLIIILSFWLSVSKSSYLSGFYGPSYARCCDWWIVDRL